jgi:hypothetical protein
MNSEVPLAESREDVDRGASPICSALSKMASNSLPVLISNAKCAGLGSLFSERGITRSSQLSVLSELDRHKMRDSLSQKSVRISA